MFVLFVFYIYNLILVVGDGVSAVLLQQTEMLHLDPGRQRSGENKVGGASERAAPPLKEEQTEGALCLRA